MGKSVGFAIARNEFIVMSLHRFDENATPIKISFHVKSIRKKFTVMRSALDKKSVALYTAQYQFKIIKTSLNSYFK